jgi:ParB family transcriptional regulator, chromosome partitioning protein
VVNGGIFSQIGTRKAEQRHCRAGPVFLNVNKRACELNQSLVKITVHPATIRQPHDFQNVMGLVEKLVVEAIEIAEVKCGQPLAAKSFDAPRDVFALLAHAVKSSPGSADTKVQSLCFAKNSNRLTPPGEIDNSAALRHSGRMAKPALGRGLGALLGGTPVLGRPAPAAPVESAIQIPPVAPVGMPAPQDIVRRVPLNRIRPSSLQPRKDFPPESLRELADSIREQGIVQPLIVRQQGESFELIAGERRWRAAQLLDLPEAPVIVRQADDRAVLEMALIENLQRENLNPIEEAHGYSQLVGQFQLTQEGVAAKVGKSRAVVANALRLLKLPSDVQTYIRDGRLSVGHAKVILGLTDEKQQKLAAERVIKEALNVRQTEGLIVKLQTREPGRGPKPGVVIPLTQDAHVADLENRLRERLGTKIQLRYKQGKGALEISFFSDEELERVLQILGIISD